MEIICIYPFDTTTDFLIPIYQYLESIDGFIGLRINENGDNVGDCYKILKSCSSNAIIVFLGHGCSRCLYYGDKKPLIDKDGFNYFFDKRIFLLSCRSSEFIELKNTDQVNSYIGFGDLLTDWAEVISEREFDVNAYKEINENIISSFRDIIVQSILDSFIVVINLHQDFQYLYLQIKLRFNKNISRLLKEKSDINSNRVLAKLLFEAKNEIVFK